jgi:1,4-alpha-glucan branching enzyme
VVLLSNEKVLISKALSDEKAIMPVLSQFILDEMFRQNQNQQQNLTALCGVNKLSDEAAFKFNNNEYCFFLSGFTSAEKVMLAGSFNNWNTMQTSMQKIDNGWRHCLKLSPGKHTYKYIIDGKWTDDPANNQKENNEHGTKNSIVFVYNYTFNLKGYKTAKKVMVAGSFNNWNPNELPMQSTAEGWKLPMYLRQGTHTYKFIVDDNWILDPENPANQTDESGNINSVLSFGNQINFRLPGFAEAKKVILSGSFNNWNQDEVRLKQTNFGWETNYALAPGLHEYKYIIDGRWIHDPANPYTTGEPPYLNSIIAVKPNHIFSLENHADAIEVIVTGSFNNWRHDGYRMQQRSNGWIFPIHLPPGRYAYKFIIDGEWIVDPDNPYYEKNEHGTDNSVLWIEQE